MISGIICLPIYDRIACLLFAFYALTIHQANIRAFYKKLYGISSVSTNDKLLIIGMLSAISLPMISYFDEHNFKIIHGLSAGVFFLSASVYQFWLTTELEKNR